MQAIKANVDGASIRNCILICVIRLVAVQTGNLYISSRFWLSPLKQQATQC